MKRINAGLLLSIISLSVFSQKVYFVDGYHGGIYGHYPVKWKTQFIVDQFNQHPEWKISLEIEPETWDTVQVQTPEAYRQFEKIVTDKRVEFTNPAYAQPYCYNISGESIIRQFEYGMKRIHRHFPRVEFTTYAVEEPCFTSSLPQLLKSFGFKYAVLKNPNTCWGGYTRAYGSELVNWVGPEGTSILTVPRYSCEELEANSTWQTTAWGNSESYLKACFDSGIKHPVGMCYQDAGWKNGPWLGFGNQIKNNSIYVTWTDYIENISIGKTNDDWHFTQEDILVSLVWGSQVLQRIAQQVRISENRIVMTEKLGTMAYLENGYRYSQHRLDEAWRTLMLAQHHDSWIVPYNQLNSKGTWADVIAGWTANTNYIASAVTNETLASFNTQPDGTNRIGFIRVYNTQGISRTEITSAEIPQELAGMDLILRDSKKKEIPCSVENQDDKTILSFKAEVPSLGYATYEIQKNKVDKKSVSGVKFTGIDECTLENDMYRIILNTSKGGTIKSLIAKKEGGKEFVDSTGYFAFNELRGFFYDDGEFYSSKDSPAQITILKDNGLETSVQIKGEIAGHPFTQVIIIAQGQRRIDFDLAIDWKGNVGIGQFKQGKDWRANRKAFYDDRFKLNVLFPTALPLPRLYKDAPFDVCESKHKSTNFNRWDEIQHNIILHWVDLVDKNNTYGLALFSDHTTSYSHEQDFPLGLTAQYSGMGLWGWNYTISQPLKMKYAVMPHRGKWDEAHVSIESDNWNEPLVSSYYLSAKLHNQSWISMEHSGYEISAAYIEGDDILVRLFNSEGDDSPKSVCFNFPVSQVDEISLNGKLINKQALKATVSGVEMQVSMPRFGLKTFLIRKK